MRVVINAAAATRVKTGIGFYVDQLLAELPRCGGVTPVAFVPWSESWMQRTGRSYSAVAGGRTDQFLHRRLRRAKQLFDAAQFRAVARRQDFDVYHEPNYVPFAFDGPVVTTVCDLTALLHPEWHPTERARFFQEAFVRRLSQTARFSVPSRFTEQQLIEHLHVPPEQIDVIPLAARPGFSPVARELCERTLARLGLPPRFLLFVGTIEPRKNLGMLLDAHRALSAVVRSRLPLVLAGPIGWNCEDIVARIERETPFVRHTGYLSNEDLIHVCNAAEMLVFPSLCEGFGLPPLEMMACGRPVVVSRCASLPEVVGDAGVYVDPCDVDGLAAAIRELIDDAELRNRLGRLGLERAAQFSWRSTANLTVAAYRQAINQRAVTGRAA